MIGPPLPGIVALTPFERVLLFRYNAVQEKFLSTRNLFTTVSRIEIFFWTNILF
jgi:hypothetical protein